MRIGFLGLGNMGTPMALRLLAAGHELSVWNRSEERTNLNNARSSMQRKPDVLQTC